MKTNARKLCVVILFTGYTFLVTWISFYTDKNVWISNTAAENKTQTIIPQNLPNFYSKGLNISTNLDLRNSTVAINCTNNNEKVKSKLAIAGRLFRKAVNYARGAKATEAMRIAARALDEVLREFGMDSKSVTYRHENEARSVCPEIYKGTKFGYPFYDKGFELVKCDRQIPEEQLVTIVTTWDESKANLSRFLKEINNYNPKLKVIIGLYHTSEVLKSNFTDVSSYISFQYFDTGTSNGHMWNKLTLSVKTPYVLVARDTIMFNEDSRIHRLIGEIERLDLVVAGGASRDINGHWKIGCLQRAFKNQTLVFEEGYYESFHECQFCDHIDSSFVISTKTFLKIKLDDTITGEGIWEDFFMRTSGESVVCPDSMFYENRVARSSDLSDWKDFGNKYKLKKMKFISLNLEFVFGCPEDYSCTMRKKGHAVEICCLQEMVNLVTFVMNTCTENTFVCELGDGTLLGAVKFQKVLPWEVDADIYVPKANFMNFKTTISKVVGKVGYRLEDRSEKGWFRIYSKHWFVEIFVEGGLSTERLIDRGLAPTKLLYDGQWMTVSRNPGLHARNRYGYGMYKHAEHWSTNGFTDSWINYNVDGFAPCTKPGSPSCLNRYNYDGNLQFSDPIP